MATSSHNHDRVKEATPKPVNKRIENETWQRVAEYRNKSNEEITTRIEKLNKEWDIERFLGVNMSTLAIGGLAIAAVSNNKKWNILPAVVLGFFFQHAIQGWCPPLPIIRMFKVRSSKEIEQEKYALKIMRGDFDNIQPGSQPTAEQLKRAIAKS